MSDNIIEVAEKIQSLYHQGIYADETDKIDAALLRSKPREEPK